ncbi:hypothetical protein BJY01DRAFT_225786 [Aspergillus pseudoustus]|uniref:Zn(2)-C6 fungal-type domain-containing protein n=1 Tax=Aspergillus pseudoustus TaxID=1810923 RepID=A0ABR4IY27_9EURO
MVYCGKPSPGCARCRSRRLKCDEERPSCSQCMRAETECPGYRNTLDLRFRDQSQEVIGKARRQHHKRASESAAAAAAAAERRGKRPPDSHSKSSRPEASLAYPEDELARGFMCANYMTPGTTSGSLTYMSSLAKDPQNLAVNAAFTAVGLAVMSNIRMSPQLLLAARREYTTALARTNYALSDAVLSKGDDTLAAVVLLGMFEVTTCTDGSFFDRWMKHMDGAAKLIELRGPEQLERPEGLHLFTQLRAQINISRIYQERASPPIIAYLTTQARKYRTAEDKVYDEFGTVGTKLADFCAAIKDNTITQPTEILRLALNLDAELTSIAAVAPPTWHYQTIPVPRADAEEENGSAPLFTPDIWGEVYHVYTNINIGSSWNHYRSALLMVHELIIDTVKELEGQPFYAYMHAEYRSLRSRSEQLSRQLVDDIIASVPFHLGTAAADAILTHASSSSSGTPANSIEGHVSCASGMALVWPLLIAANSGFASRELRTWIIAVLEKIGYSMGLNQALAMARLLHEGMQSRAWLEPGYTNCNSPAEMESGY